MVVVVEVLGIDGCGGGDGGQDVDGEISVFRVGTRWAPIIRLTSWWW